MRSFCGGRLERYDEHGVPEWGDLGGGGLGELGCGRDG